MIYLAYLSENGELKLLLVEEDDHALLIVAM